MDDLEFAYYAMSRLWKIKIPNEKYYKNNVKYYVIKN